MPVWMPNICMYVFCPSMFVSTAYICASLSTEQHVLIYMGLSVYSCLAENEYVWMCALIRMDLRLTCVSVCEYTLKSACVCVCRAGPAVVHTHTHTGLGRVFVEWVNNKESKGNTVTPQRTLYPPENHQTSDKNWRPLWQQTGKWDNTLPLETTEQTSNVAD